MKKKATREGQFYGLRCSSEDSDKFEQASQAEGFSTTQQWLLWLARQRCREILAADSAKPIYEEIASLIDRVAELERRLPSEE